MATTSAVPATLHILSAAQAHGCGGVRGGLCVSLSRPASVPQGWWGSVAHAPPTTPGDAALPLLPLLPLDGEPLCPRCARHTSGQGLRVCAVRSRSTLRPLGVSVFCACVACKTPSRPGFTQLGRELRAGGVSLASSGSSVVCACAYVCVGRDSFPEPRKPRALRRVCVRAGASLRARTHARLHKNLREEGQQRVLCATTHAHTRKGQHSAVLQRHMHRPHAPVQRDGNRITALQPTLLTYH